jgi:hypothetical protein
LATFGTGALLGLSVNLVTATETAELVELKLACGGLLVLGGAVVLAFAFLTLQVNDLAHGDLLLRGRIGD